ncbi:MAG TPA: hypothetical protein VIY48_12160 [Candidatus Paceibacterota bacterium]
MPYMAYDKISSRSQEPSAGFPPPRRMQMRPLIVFFALAAASITCFVVAFEQIRNATH